MKQGVQRTNKMERRNRLKAQLIFRKTEAERKIYRDGFQKHILTARQKTKKQGNKNEKELRVVPMLDPKVEPWYIRSLKSNGLLMNTHREKHSIKIVMRNTCVQNSILQAFTWLYIDDEDFRKFIDEFIRKSRKADLARLIAIFAQNGFGEHVYRLRRQLSSSSCFSSLIDGVRKFECASATFENIHDLVFPLFSTMTLTTDCKCRIEKKFATIPIDAAYFREHKLKGLQTAIEKRIKNKNRVCNRCGRKCSENHEFSDVVLIQVGLPVHDLIEVNDSGEIPQIIILKNQKYVLTCFSDAYMNQSPNHFMMNCLRRGDWYHYDDVSDSAKKLKGGGLVDILIYKKMKIGETEEAVLVHRLANETVSKLKIN